MNFKITEKEGYNYSIKSGDKNKIHLDSLTSYNSFFGEKICHGTLVLQKTLRLIKIKKHLKNLDQYFISINFLKHFIYNKTIKLTSKQNMLYQGENKIAEINIKKKIILKKLKRVLFLIKLMIKNIKTWTILVF